MSNEFLELLETIRVEDASIGRLFNTATDGRGIRSMRRDDPRYQRSLAEAADLVARVYRGSTPMHRLQEAMSTSDFPLLFGDIIDRQLLGQYTEWPTAWRSISRRATVRDFRPKKLLKTDGAEGTLDEVAQGAEYPEAAVTEGKYEYSVKKHGRRVPFLWETFINDDLDALRDTPARLAKAARMSEERFVTGLYASASGPNASFFSAGNDNLLTGVESTLDVESLREAFKLLWTQVDTDGNPIFTGAVRLVVPPHLAVVGREILNATELRVTQGSDLLNTRNWMATEVAELVVNPWLPLITTTGSVGETAWYLFASPDVGRPALEVGFLRGHESPELFLKTPNATRIGGGMVAAEDGNFESDGIDYKVRHVFGGTLLEPKAAVASKGQA